MTHESDGTSFWPLAQRLQAQGQLCDVQLLVSSADDPEVSDVIHAHKLVLVSTSHLFRSALETGELLDVYNFVGISRANLQLVVDFMYRRCPLKEVMDNSEAAFAAQAIQVITDRKDGADEADGAVGGSDTDEAGEEGLTRSEAENLTATEKSDLSVQERTQSPSLDREGEIQGVEGHGKEDRLARSICNKEEVESSAGDNSLSVMNTHVEAAVSENNSVSDRSDVARVGSPVQDLREQDKSETSDPDPEMKVGESSSAEKSQSSHASSKRKHLQKSTGKVKAKQTCVMSGETVSPELKSTAKSPKSGASDKARLTGALELTARVKDCASPLGRSTAGRRRKTLNYRLLAEGRDLGEEDVSANGDQNGELTPSLNEKKRLIEETDPDFIAPVMEVKKVRRTPESELSCVSPDPVKGVTEGQGGLEPEENLAPSDAGHSPDKSGDNSEGAVEEDTGYRCGNCPRVFKVKSSLTLHRKAVHRIHVKLKCEACAEEFGALRHLEKHRSEAHGLLAHCCTKCGLTFKTREGLKVHDRKKHTEEKPLFECSVCQKTFFVRGELKQHMLFHADERGFQCDQCTRAFKSKQLLARHLSTFHSTARNFQCDVCQAMFKTRNDCKAHRLKHFRDKNPLVQGYARGKRFPDGEQYKCSFCDRVFEKRTQQKVHERLQHKQRADGTSYLCTVCSKVFPIKHYLMQHIKNAHSQRTHTCQQCMQSFAQGGDLRKHQTLPGRCKGRLADPKPFSCPHCLKGFSLKGNLSKHLQRPNRCRGQNAHPEVIVVLQQTAGEGQEGSEGAPAAEGEVETQALEGTTIQVTEDAAEGFQLYNQAAVEDVALQGLVDGKLVPVSMTNINGQVQFTIQDGLQNAEVIQYAIEEQGQSQGQDQGQSEGQGQGQGEYQVVQNVVTEGVDGSVIQLVGGEMSGTDPATLQVLQIQSVIEGHQDITQGHLEVTAGQPLVCEGQTDLSQGQGELVYHQVIEGGQQITEETVPELAMQVTESLEGQVVLAEQEVISQGQEVISQGQEVISQGQGVITQVHELVSQSQEVVTQIQEVVSQGQEVVGQGEEVVSQGQEVISPGPDVITLSEEVLAETVEEVRGELTQDGEQVIHIQNVVYLAQPDELQQAQSLLID